MAAGLWKSPLTEVAEDYADDILDNVATYGVIANNMVDLESSLERRARLEREGFVTESVKLADAAMLQYPVRESWWPDFSLPGPEWPYHMADVIAGLFPLDQIPEHMRDLAKQLYYSKAA